MQIPFHTVIIYNNILENVLKHGFLTTDPKKRSTASIQIQIFFDPQGQTLSLRKTSTRLLNYI